MAEARAVNTFLQRTRAAGKIIVVDFGFLGDSIHLAPALWEIKRHYPAAELHTLSAPVGAELLALAPCVDQVHAFPLKSQSPAWWRHWGVLLALRRERFDVAFNFSGSDRTIFSTALIGAASTLAREGERKHFWQRWLGVEWVSKTDSGLPIFEQRRRLLAAAGCTLEPARFDLCVPEEARSWAADVMPEKAIHFAISASTPVKEWPLENWVGLVRMLAKKNPSARIVATAGSNPREQERLQQLTRIAGGAPLLGLTSLSIPRLAAVLQRCRLQVGADSGVLHLAMALGVPTVTVFRRYHDQAEWMPAGPQHRQISAPCPCIDGGKNDCLAAGRSACLAGIAPGQVLAEILQLEGP